MRYPRRNFGALSMEAAPGLFEDDEAPADAVAALAAAAPAFLRIYKCGADGATTIAALLDREQTTGERRRVTANGVDYSWSGLAVYGAGDPRRADFAFESDGVIYHAITEIAANLWADYFPFFEHAVLTLDLGGEPHPILPLEEFDTAPPANFRSPPPQDYAADLRRRVNEAAARAGAAIASLDFDAAERMVLSVDSDIHGAAALAAAYEAALAATPVSTAIFERALYWARRAAPEPHTAIEAENFRATIEESEARLIALRAAADH